MRRLVNILTLLLSVHLANGQKLVPDVHDLGRVKLYNNPTLIYTFTNTTKEPVMFMPTNYMMNLEIILPEGMIQPGESVKIRVRYFTEDFGSINVHQPVFINTRNEPLYINISGKIISFHPSALTMCPSMNKSEAEVRLEQSSSPTITTYDKETGLTIDGADFIFTGRENRFLIENSRNAMVTLAHIPIGLYTVEVAKQGYRPVEKTLYISRGGGHFVIEMEPVDSTGYEEPIVAETPRGSIARIPDNTETETETETEREIARESSLEEDDPIIAMNRDTEEQEDEGPEIREIPEVDEIPEKDESDIPDADPEEEDEVFVITEPEDEEHSIDRIRRAIRERYADQEIIERDVVLTREDSSDAEETEETVEREEEQLAEVPEIRVDTTETRTPEKEVLPDFNEAGELTEKYAENNIVFLIDISSSMGKPEKLPLLQEAMKNMVSVLRASDRVTIITYASSTEVVLSSVPGDRKEEIYRIIDSLKAFGYSKGADGMGMAYTEARRNFISSGNNQVILATDGLFNSTDLTEEDLYDMARENEQNHHIRLSVVAFGKSRSAISFMRGLSQNGRGSYIRIDPTSEGNKALVIEIMNNALR